MIIQMEQNSMKVIENIEFSSEMKCSDLNRYVQMLKFIYYLEKITKFIKTVYQSTYCCFKKFWYMFAYIVWVRDFLCLPPLNVHYSY